MKDAMLQQYKNDAGFIPEEELDQMLGDNDVAGGDFSTWVCVAVTVVTSWDVCPTSACSTMCWKP